VVVIGVEGVGLRGYCVVLVIGGHVRCHRDRVEEEFVREGVCKQLAMIVVHFIDDAQLGIGHFVLEDFVQLPEIVDAAVVGVVRLEDRIKVLEVGTLHNLNLGDERLDGVSINCFVVLYDWGCRQGCGRGLCDRARGVVYASCGSGTIVSDRSCRSSGSCVGPVVGPRLRTGTQSGVGGGRSLIDNVSGFLESRSACAGCSLTRGS